MLDRIKFLLRSQNNQELHSPFVFDLYQNIITKHLHNFNQEEFIEELKKYYSSKKNIIVFSFEKEIEDFKKDDLVFLSFPYQNYFHWKNLKNNSNTVFSINFYYGAIFSFDKIAPKQEFYLR
ncbi:MAG: hypothetical protein RIR51_1194 [Bacteroidota bacterium]|jgi:hypothetical protein